MSDFLANLARRAAGLPPTTASPIPARPPEPYLRNEIEGLHIEDELAPEAADPLPPPRVPRTVAPSDELRPPRAEGSADSLSPGPEPGERTATVVQSPDWREPSEEISDTSTTPSPILPAPGSDTIEASPASPNPPVVLQPSPPPQAEPVRAEARPSVPDQQSGSADEMVSVPPPTEPLARGETRPERPADREARIVPRPMPDEAFDRASEAAMVLRKTEPPRPPVEVRIGRIDIEVARPAPPPAAPAPRERPRGFDDYARLRSYLER